MINGIKNSFVRQAKQARFITTFNFSFISMVKNNSKMTVKITPLINYMKKYFNDDEREERRPIAANLGTCRKNAQRNVK
jgi:hypothetical protein